MRKPTPARGQVETLDYIQSMLGQLRLMAAAERCGMLTYLIEMAYVEAGDVIRYTSLGTGSSIVPVRFNCPPEVTLHHLHLSS